MLVQLSIKNYALIEHTTISFRKNLSIITGETGAGKSILLDALALVIGKRADLSALRNKEQKCIIEASFDIEYYNLKDFFDNNDLDFESLTILRREILPSGKSRAFVNDSPVSLAILQQVGAALIDIHSQHQTHDLFDENYQLNLIDVFAKTDKEKKSYTEALRLYKAGVKELENLQLQQAQLIKEHDYNLYLFNELESFQLRLGEEEELLQEESSLSNIENIQENLAASAQLLANDSVGIITQIKELRSFLSKLSSYNNDYQDMAQRIQSVEIECLDISSEIESKLEEVYADPQRLEFVQNRLQALAMLYKKHQVSTVEELYNIYQNLADKVLQNESIEELLQATQNKVAHLKIEVDNTAAILHQKRSACLEELTTLLEKNIHPLGMPNARFKIQLLPTDQYYTNGKDQIQLLFAANKGMDFGLLKKTASGGELSRIMLVVKSILATRSNMPTIIFDEIDTGVSGEVADKMGVIMKEMGNNMQVFAITHLAQVAAKGDAHYKVFKHDVDERTTSEITLLTQEQRVEEIAQMISGTTITESALNQAKALLNI